MDEQIDCDYIKRQFEKEGYKFLTKKYINNKQKLKYICPKRHRHSISWTKWQQGRRCPYCDGQGKPTIEFIRSEFENEGYKLLTKEYINCKQKLDYICPNNHKYRMSWHQWNGSKQRCPYCSGKYVSEEAVIDYFFRRGYKVLSIDELGWNACITYECCFGHKHITRYSSRYRVGCPTCAYINKSGSGHPNWKGGISCEPYCDVWLDKDFKESIKQRDNYQCQNPDCWETSKKLVIHHIDYNKKNCSKENLITLCNSCNSRANKDREWHKHWYQIIMNKKYDICYV